MSTYEITGTVFGAPRMQCAAEANAGTGTSGGFQSYLLVEQPTDGGILDASRGLWASLAGQWELVRLSRRTPWGTIIGPGFAQGRALYAYAATAHHDDIPEAPIGYVETLGRVKHYLSLNTTELAAVLRVGRPTVYAWMQGGPMRAANRERLSLVYGIATKWWNRAKQPLGPYLQLKGGDGQSVLDLIQADLINESALEPFFKVAANRIERAAQDKAQRAESYKVLAERHGFAPVPQGVRDRTLRQFGAGGEKP